MSATTTLLIRSARRLTILQHHLKKNLHDPRAFSSLQSDSNTASAAAAFAVLATAAAAAVGISYDNNNNTEQLLPYSQSILYKYATVPATTECSDDNTDTNGSNSNASDATNRPTVNQKQSNQQQTSQQLQQTQQLAQNEQVAQQPPHHHHHLRRDTPHNVMVQARRSIKGRNLEDKYQVDWNNVLGEGAYGSVHPARLAATGEKVCKNKELFLFVKSQHDETADTTHVSYIGCSQENKSSLHKHVRFSTRDECFDARV
jgi:hypothetical protein